MRVWRVYVGGGGGNGGWGEEWSRMRHHRPTDAVLKLRKRRWVGGRGGGAETLQNAVCHLLLKTGMIVSLNWQLLHSSTWMALYHLTSPAVCPSYSPSRSLRSSSRKLMTLPFVSPKSAGAQFF